MSKLPLPDLGAYLREQRENAQLSLRQLADMAGISNPYLSQIERGLKRPSAEILQQIAKGLQVSAESLYVRAGILDERVLTEGSGRAVGSDVLSAIAADPLLTDRQRGVLVDIYLSFVGAAAPTPSQTPTAPVRRRRSPRSAPAPVAAEASADALADTLTHALTDALSDPAGVAPGPTKDRPVRPAEGSPARTTTGTTKRTTKGPTKRPAKRKTKGPSTVTVPDTSPDISTDSTQKEN